MTPDQIKEEARIFWRSNARVLPSAAYLKMKTGAPVDVCQDVLDLLSGKKKPVPKVAPVQKVLEVQKVTGKIPSRFVRWGFLIAAFGALPRTFEFIREWLERSSPHPLNILTALVFVLALFLGFQAFVMLKHWSKWFLLFFTSLLLLFSVFCTVDGVYFSRSSKIDIDSVKSSLILTDLEGKLERMKAENVKIQGILDGIENSELSFWNKDYQRSKVGKIQDLGPIEERIIAAKIGTVSESRPDILRGDFEIIILVVFSVLLDLIGPMALAVALFLPRGKNE